MSIREQDGVDISGSIDLPGGLGMAFAGGTLYLGPVQTEDAEPYDLRMQLLDEHGQELETVRLKMEAVTSGPTGEGVRAFGVEEYDVFTLEIRVDHTTQQVQLALRLTDMTGRRPAEVLPGLRAVAAFRPPHRVRFAALYGPTTHAGMPIPDQTNLDLGRIVNVVEAIGVIQDHTTEQLTIPDAVQLSRQARELVRTAQLVLAGSLAATWRTRTEPVAADALDPHGDLSTLARCVFMTPLVAAIGDRRVVLGFRRDTLASARVESITPSADRQHLLLKLVPGDDDAALIEYVPGPAGVAEEAD